MLTLGTDEADFPKAALVPNRKLVEVANDVFEKSENLLELFSKDAKLDCFLRLHFSGEVGCC